MDVPEVLCLWTTVAFETSFPKLVSHPLPRLHPCRVQLKKQLQFIVVMSNSLSLQAGSQSSLPLDNSERNCLRCRSPTHSSRAIGVLDV